MSKRLLKIILKDKYNNNCVIFISREIKTNVYENSSKLYLILMLILNYIYMFIRFLVNQEM